MEEAIKNKLKLFDKTWKDCLFCLFILILMGVSAVLNRFVGFNLGIVFLLSLIMEGLCLLGVRLRKINKAILEKK
jgi:hypothetical protein